MNKKIVILTIIIGALAGVSLLKKKELPGLIDKSRNIVANFQTTNKTGTEIFKGSTVPAPKQSLPEKMKEISDMAEEIEALQKKTDFDYRKMTEKEYADAVALLDLYNQRMKVFLDEEKGSL